MEEDARILIHERLVVYVWFVLYLTTLCQLQILDTVVGLKIMDRNWPCIISRRYSSLEGLRKITKPSVRSRFEPATSRTQVSLSELNHFVRVSRVAQSI